MAADILNVQQIVQVLKGNDVVVSAYNPGWDYLGELRQEKELEWTYFSPAIPMNREHSGMRKGHYRLGLDNPVFDAEGQSVLSVEDLAVAIADEVGKPKHIRRRFAAGY